MAQATGLDRNIPSPSQQGLAPTAVSFGARGQASRSTWAATVLYALFAWAAVAGAAPAPRSGAPTWNELSPAQQQVLSPLSAEWDVLEPERRQKWLGIAERYPKMSATAQKRVQSRMQRWAKLSPEQRREAREKYRRIEKLPVEKRQNLRERWAEYQALPPQERQKVNPPPRPPRSTPRRAAATEPAVPVRNRAPEPIKDW